MYGDTGGKKFIYNLFNRTKLLIALETVLWRNFKKNIVPMSVRCSVFGVRREFEAMSDSVLGHGSN